MPGRLKQFQFAFIGIVLVTTLLVACGSSASSKTIKQAQPAANVPLVKIPLGQELFDPFILTIKPNTTVTWQNQDSAAHTIRTTWDHSVFLNPAVLSLTVAAGQQTSFTFTTPGIYDYFDNTQATWNKTKDRVQANQSVPNYPLSMEGLIWVQGSLTSLPSTETNVIPDGQDEFSTDFVAVNQNGTLSWHNQDTDTHFISEIPGWSMPLNMVSFGIMRIPGTDDAPPNGGTASFTFHTPGLYYYFCAEHADINSTWHRASARKDASEYPIPMEGFVLVV